MLLSIRSILVLTIIACGFTAADLATDQKKKCTYGCGRANSAMREAGCALRVGRNEKTHQDSWLLKKGNPTEGHPGYYNCLGTGMNRPVCCLNKKIVYTPGFWLKAMVVDGNGEYPFEFLCNDAPDFNPTWGDPTDCQ
ncbi:hypothetical protein MJO28_014082 [Puccinia striiformis f. sp. tritici]|uniref:Secreted protein n=3 Tax=Puccinia striiformis TaxID=27350 RepID=A0A0L0W100_9BASI|nr:hypothetical protein MJO28_014082 [Puccinia striiformis f. sp. tritici]KAI7941837.1 hypothetical protein MJO29_013911 [Puccinia striiformis f. sp. tritici]KNF05174.1 hypothetical protein PSTG_01801 [Puccinia striiformis f. sp. tritici PST-78]POW13254.1 hypothetical protein PSHT_07817 [Puccinia striiformis]